jgi:hypothetical protein
MSRKQFLHARIAVLGETDRLPPAFAPGGVNRAAGFKVELAGIGAQFTAEITVLVEAARRFSSFWQVQRDSFYRGAGKTMPAVAQGYSPGTTYPSL